MNELNCESVCLSAMEMLDGREAALSRDVIEEHMSSCSSCRVEVEQLRALGASLGSQQRKNQTGDVWPIVSARIHAGESAPSSSSPPFVVLGLLLLSYKLVELIPDRGFGLLFKMVSVLLVIGVFGLLKENPFKINTQLRLEGE